MTIDSAFRARAAELSGAWAAFLDFVASNADIGKSADMSDVHCDWPVQSWPTFVSAQRHAEIARATTSVFKLMRSIPERIFGGDAARIAAYYGIRPAALAPMMLAEPRGLDIAIGRADLIDGDAGFKCVELNPFGSLGGLETEFMLDAYRRTPAYSRFVASSGLQPKYRRCMLALFEHMIRATLSAGIAGEEVNLAAIAAGDRPAFAQYGDLPDAVFREALANIGAHGRFIRCRPEEVKDRSGDLYFGDVRLHAIWEYVAERYYPSRFVLAFKRGRAAYFNAPLAGHFGSKRNLALLSQSVELYDGEERDAIERYIPWSREVVDGDVDFDGRRYGMVELLRERRVELVLKKGLAFGGEQVHLGESTPAAQWDEALRAAIQEGGWIVQEFVRPRTYLYQWGDEGCTACHAVWGAFNFGDVFGGSYLRILPVSQEGPINSLRGAMTGFVFEA